MQEKRWLQNFHFVSTLKQGIHQHRFVQRNRAQPTTRYLQESTVTRGIKTLAMNNRMLLNFMTSGEVLPHAH